MNDTEEDMDETEAWILASTRRPIRWVSILAYCQNHATFITFDLDEEDFAHYVTDSIKNVCARCKSAITYSQARALIAQQSEDDFVGIHFTWIRGLLPAPERGSGFDVNPPEAVTEILLESKVLGHCTQLLRNDSLEDAQRRKRVYRPLFRLLRSMGSHVAVANRTIFAEQQVRKPNYNLLTRCFQGQSEVSTHTTRSLSSYLKDFSAQGELVLQGARCNEKEFRGYHGENLLMLCTQISDLQRYLCGDSAVHGDELLLQDDSGVPSLTNLCDDEILSNHAFASEARALQGARPGRVKRLITELTSLKTGLPPGIFVRFARGRPDVLKVIIIGPVSTPYEHGLFEFDFYCPSDYPINPPLVRFKTTGGGSIRFNPNLYKDGLVCLSLLGTWHGKCIFLHKRPFQILMALQGSVGKLISLHYFKY